MRPDDFDRLPAVPDIDFHNASTPFEPELDVSLYKDKLENFDLTEDQKVELLHTLWGIMRSFVELGFNGELISFPETEASNE